MDTPATFRKKPVEIQAIQWTGENVEALIQFVADDSLYFGMDQYDHITDLFITTLEGDMKANVGDWIIRGLKGEYYPCSDEVFQMTYDKTEAQSTIAQYEQVYSSWIERVFKNTELIDADRVLQESEKLCGCPVLVTTPRLREMYPDVLPSHYVPIWLKGESMHFNVDSNVVETINRMLDKLGVPTAMIKEFDCEQVHTHAQC